MKVVSLNLWNGGRLFDQALEFLAQQDADLYFLQEVYDGHGAHLENRLRTVELLTAAFPGFSVQFAALYVDTRQREGRIEDGQLLISRWPLTDHHFVWFDVPYGEYDNDDLSASKELLNFPAGVQVAQIQYQGHPIRLLNVHGPWNNDGTADTIRRQNMRDKILALIGEFTIVAGDFNAQPIVPSIADLEKPLVSVFKHQVETTFNLRRKDLQHFPGFATAVVDMMLVTPNLRVISRQVPQVDVSDHLPLVAELEW